MDVVAMFGNPHNELEQEIARLGEIYEKDTVLQTEKIRIIVEMCRSSVTSRDRRRAAHALSVMKCIIRGDYSPFKESTPIDFLSNKAVYDAFIDYALNLFFQWDSCHMVDVMQETYFLMLVKMNQSVEWRMPQIASVYESIYNYFHAPIISLDAKLHFIYHLLQEWKNMLLAVCSYRTENGLSRPLRLGEDLLFLVLRTVKNVLNDGLSDRMAKCLLLSVEQILWQVISVHIIRRIQVDLDSMQSPKTKWIVCSAVCGAFLRFLEVCVGCPRDENHLLAMRNVIIDMCRSLLLTPSCPVADQLKTEASKRIEAVEALYRNETNPYVNVEMSIENCGSYCFPQFKSSKKNGGGYKMPAPTFAPAVAPLPPPAPPPPPLPLAPIDVLTIDSTSDSDDCAWDQMSDEDIPTNLPGLAIELSMNYEETALLQRNSDVSHNSSLGDASSAHAPVEEATTAHARNLPETMSTDVAVDSSVYVGDSSQISPAMSPVRTLASSVLSEASTAVMLPNRNLSVSPLAIEQTSTAVLPNQTGGSPLATDPSVTTPAPRRYRRKYKTRRMRASEVLTSDDEEACPEVVRRRQPTRHCTVNAKITRKRSGGTGSRTGSTPPKLRRGTRIDADGFPALSVSRSDRQPFVRLVRIPPMTKCHTDFVGFSPIDPNDDLRSLRRCMSLVSRLKRVMDMLTCNEEDISQEPPHQDAFVSGPQPSEEAPSEIETPVDTTLNTAPRGSTDIYEFSTDEDDSTAVKNTRCKIRPERNTRPQVTQSPAQNEEAAETLEVLPSQASLVEHEIINDLIERVAASESSSPEGCERSVESCGAPDVLPPSIRDEDANNLEIAQTSSSVPLESTVVTPDTSISNMSQPTVRDVPESTIETPCTTSNEESQPSVCGLLESTIETLCTSSIETSQPSGLTPPATVETTSQSSSTDTREESPLYDSQPDSPMNSFSEESEMIETSSIVESEIISDISRSLSHQVLEISQASSEDSLRSLVIQRFGKLYERNEAPGQSLEQPETSSGSEGRLVIALSSSSEQSVTISSCGSDEVDRTSSIEQSIITADVQDCCEQSETSTGSEGRLVIALSSGSEQSVAISSCRSDEVDHTSSSEKFVGTSDIPDCCSEPVEIPHASISEEVEETTEMSNRYTAQPVEIQPASSSEEVEETTEISNSYTAQPVEISQISTCVEPSKAIEIRSSYNDELLEIFQTLTSEDPDGQSEMSISCSDPLLITSQTIPESIKILQTFSSAELERTSQILPSISSYDCGKEMYVPQPSSDHILSEVIIETTTQEVSTESTQLYTDCENSRESAGMQQSSETFPDVEITQSVEKSTENSVITNSYAVDEIDFDLNDVIPGKVSSEPTMQNDIINTASPCVTDEPSKPSTSRSVKTVCHPLKGDSAEKVPLLENSRDLRPCATDEVSKPRTSRNERRPSVKSVIQPLKASSDEKVSLLKDVTELSPCATGELSKPSSSNERRSSVKTVIHQKDSRDGKVSLLKKPRTSRNERRPSDQTVIHPLKGSGDEKVSLLKNVTELSPCATGEQSKPSTSNNERRSSVRTVIHPLKGSSEEKVQSLKNVRNLSTCATDELSKLRTSRNERRSSVKTVIHPLKGSSDENVTLPTNVRELSPCATNELSKPRTSRNERRPSVKTVIHSLKGSSDEKVSLLKNVGELSPCATDEISKPSTSNNERRSSVKTVRELSPCATNELSKPSTSNNERRSSLKTVRELSPCATNELSKPSTSLKERRSSVKTGRELSPCATNELSKPSTSRKERRFSVKTVIHPLKGSSDENVSLLKNVRELSPCATDELSKPSTSSVKTVGHSFKGDSIEKVPLLKMNTDLSDTSDSDGDLSLTQRRVMCKKIKNQSTLSPRKIKSDDEHSRSSSDRSQESTESETPKPTARRRKKTAERVNVGSEPVFTKLRPKCEESTGSLMTSAGYCMRKSRKEAEERIKATSRLRSHSPKITRPTIKSVRYNQSAYVKYLDDRAGKVFETRTKSKDGGRKRNSPSKVKSDIRSFLSDMGCSFVAAGDEIIPRHYNNKAINTLLEMKKLIDLDKKNSEGAKSRHTAE